MHLYAITGFESLFVNGGCECQGLQWGSGRGPCPCICFWNRFPYISYCDIAVLVEDVHSK